jgi:hypothetical protein
MLTGTVTTGDQYEPHCSLQYGGDVVGPPRTRISELRLVVDGSKEYGNGRFGFVDVFVINENGNAIVLELKDIRLGELLSGRHGRLINPPDYTEMDKLDEEVSSVDEKSLDKMPYIYWSKDQSRGQSRPWLVKSERMPCRSWRDICKWSIWVPLRTGLILGYWMAR